MKNNKTYIPSLFSKLTNLTQKYSLFRKMKALMYYSDAVLSLFIKKPKYKHSKKKKVLIIYNLAFGDGVIFRCSLIYLRKIYPKNKYDITLICQKGIDKLYDKDDIFDKIIAIDCNKATVNLKERIKNFKIIRENYYDIIIDPVGIFEYTTNVLYTRFAVGNKKIGYIDNNSKVYISRRKIKKIYNRIIELDKKDVSLLEYYNIFFNKLAGKENKIPLGFQKLKTTPTKLELPKDYFIIFPSASIGLKRWPINRFAELAKKVYQKTNMTLVLVGTQTDLEAINELVEQLDTSIPYLNLVLKTSLNDYIDIIKKAKLVITNDTSAYHIAVIEEVNCALIAGAYTYDRYALYDFPNKEKYKRPCVIVKDKSCKNCNNRCPYLNKDDKTWPCLNEITVNYAFKKIEKLLDENN